MLKKYLPPVLILISTAFFSCASMMYYDMAKTQFKQGNYTQSVFMAVASLQEDPENLEATLLIEEVFPLAVAQSLEQIETYRLNAPPFMWSLMVSEYEAIHNMNDAVKRLPPELYIKKENRAPRFKYTYYYEKLKEARQNAAEEHYTAGLRLMAGTKRTDKQEAYKEFKAAEKYLSPYKNAAELAEQCLKQGMNRLMILPVTNGRNHYPGMNINTLATEILFAAINQSSEEKIFTMVIDRTFTDKILEEQYTSQTDPFDSETAVKIGSLSGANMMLSCRILRITYTPPDIIKDTRQLQKELTLPASKTVEDFEEQTSVLSETVTAEINYFTRTASLEITGSYSLIDMETSEVKDSNIFTQQETDTAEWAEFTGDLRALSREDIRLLDGSRKLKDETVMLKEAVFKLQNKMAREVMKKLN